jgi:hypothetical protein
MSELGKYYKIMGCFEHSKDISIFVRSGELLSEING